MEFRTKTKSFNDVENLEELLEITPQVCRICLKLSKIQKSMFHCFYSDKSYSEIYHECTGYRVLDDKQLPTKLCNLCETNLLSVWNFLIRTNGIESLLQVHYESNGFSDVVEEAEDQDPKEIEIEDNIEEESQIEVEYENENDSRYEVVVQDVEIDENIDHIENNMDVIEEEMFTEMTSEHASETENDPDAEQDPENEEYLDDEEYDQEQHKEVTLDVEHAYIPSKDGFSLECIVCGPSQCRQLSENYETTFQCGFCSKTFKDKKIFYNHQKIHFGDRRYECRVCGEKFIHWQTRAGHEANTHNIGWKFECERCKKPFYRKDRFDAHLKTCINREETIFQCEVCLFRFQRKETYQKHMKSAHQNVTEEEVERIQRLVKEKQEEVKHEEAKVSLLTQEVITLAEIVSDTEENFNEPNRHENICTLCHKTFKNQMTLKRHLSTVHATTKRFKCKHCEEYFTHRSTMMYHMSDKHDVKKPYQCTKCDYSCFKRERFNAHMDKHDNPDKLYECPICQEKFKSHTTMAIHRAKHNRSETYSCNVCGREFIDKRNYTVHLRLHTGQNLFHCEICNRGFNKKEHMKKHLNVHKSEA
ncbi:unnamed protein product [Diamesa serratosioi]